MEHRIKHNFVSLFLALSVVIIVLSACSVNDSNNPTDSPSENPNEQDSSVVATLHAAALVREFEGNEVRANQLYRNKRVRIYGNVNSIESNDGGQITLTFKSSISTYGVARCFFSNSYSAKLAEIKSNDEATVEGTVRGYSNPLVILENCTIP